MKRSILIVCALAGLLLALACRPPLHVLIVETTRHCQFCRKETGVTRDSFNVGASYAGVLAEVRKLGLSDYAGPSAPVEQDLTVRRMLDSLKLGRRHYFLATFRDTCESCAAAQKLLQEVARRDKLIKDKLIKRNAERADSIYMLTHREEGAKRMEVVFLLLGWDVTVKLSGDNKTTMRLEYVLWSRPLVYQFMFMSLGDSSLLATLRKTGFKKLVFDDKYENTWTYDLVGSQWR